MDTPTIPSFGFIILRNVTDFRTNLFWNIAYEQIKRLYGENTPILIIDDNSDENLIKEKEGVVLSNTNVIKSNYTGRGELLPYYYYLENKLFDTACIIHDTLFIRENIELNTDDCKFLWTYKHKETDNSEDIVKILSVYENNDLVDFYNNKELWSKCFGSMSIIKHDYLKLVNQKFPLEKLLPLIENKETRGYVHSIISVLLTFSNNNTNKSFSNLLGDIETYCKWGDNMNNMNNTSLPFVKVWIGR